MAKPEPVIEISAELLQRLHRIHRQRNDLQGRIDRGPRKVAAGAARVEQARGDVSEADELIKKAKLTADRRQLQLKEREDHIVVLQGRLNAAASNREYDSFKEQIAADEQANSVLSDEILETLERIDELELDREKRRQTLKEREAEQALLEQTVAQETAELRDEFARVEVEREEAEALIPPGARAEYRRLVAARGEEALAPVDGESCGGCYQTLTTQIISRLMLSQLVRCPNCNAFLYQRTSDVTGA